MPISIPKFFQRAFAQNGGKQDVPITGDNSGGRASYDVGFPPVTRVPIVAGGIPPFGTDFNGVLYDLSQAIQYVQSGVSFPFDQDFATEIGGYEIGAIVSDASDKTLLWVNGAANNTAFPSGWTSFNRSDPTETVRGLPLVATQAEVNAGANDAKVVTPQKLLFGIMALWGETGYIVLPKFLLGLSLQWGRTEGITVTAAVKSATVTLPIENTGGTYVAFCESNDVDVNGQGTRVRRQTIGNSSFGFSYSAPATLINARVAWFAIGRVL